MTKAGIAASRKREALYKKAHNLYRQGLMYERAGDPVKATANYRKAEALMRRLNASGKFTEGPVGVLPNPNWTNSAANKAWRQVKVAELAMLKARDIAYDSRVAGFGKINTQKFQQASTRLQRAQKRLEELHSASSEKRRQARDSGLITAREFALGRPEKNPLPLDEWDIDEDAAFNEGSQVARALGSSVRAHRQGLKHFKGGYYSKARGKFVEFIMPIKAHSVTEAKAQVKAMVTNEKAINVTAREVKRTNNPGLIEIAGTLEAADYLQKAIRGKKNPDSQYIEDFLDTNDSLGWGKGLTPSTFLARRLSGSAQQYKMRYQAALEAAADRLVESGYVVLGPSAGKKTTYYGRSVKRNPSVQSLSKTFQGKATGAISEMKAANSAPRDLARIGKLVFIKLAGSKSQTRAPGAMVAVDTKGKLWLVGAQFKQKAKAGEMLDFGQVDKICYFTTKAHIENGKPTEYVHTFGEEGGKRPRLLVDFEGMPVFRGGDYKIEARGIVN